MRDFWKKFLAGFAVTLAIAGGVYAGGSGPTVVEPYIWTNDGTAAAPAHAFVSETNTGFYRAGAQDVRLSIAGSAQFRLTNSAALGLVVGTNLPLSWGVGGPDLFLYRDTANTLAQRNATNAQTHRIYGTYTDASNYERVDIIASTTAFIQTASAGTGTARDLVLGTAGSASTALMTVGTRRWTVSSAGNFTANADNTYDIGASGANRPRDIYVADDGVFGGDVVTNTVDTAGFTVATLPTCNAGAAGTRAYVTDATAPTYLGALVGGGAVVAPVFCNGTAWVSG